MPLDFNNVGQQVDDPAVLAWYSEEIRRAVGDEEYWRVERVKPEPDKPETETPEEQARREFGPGSWEDEIDGRDAEEQLPAESEQPDWAGDLHEDAQRQAQSGTARDSEPNADTSPLGYGGDASAGRANASRGARYVRTKDAERLIKGRGQEALQKIGVPWPGRGTHIHCPLGLHPDNNPSWRWDKDCDRYFCTCGNGSIFDVVMRMCHLDFEGAKIHIAELLDRTDLVRESGGGSRGITIADVAAAKGLPVPFLRETMGWQDEPRYGKYHKPAIIMPWWDGKGGQWDHIRVALEGDKRFFWREGHKGAPLYGIWLPMPEPGYIIIVEGETDVATCLLTGFSAWGIPGAPGGWNEQRHTDLVEHFPVIFVIIEPGKAGDELLKRIARSRIAPQVRFVRMPPDTKDPNKLYLINPKAFVEAFRAMLKAAERFDSEKHGGKLREEASNHDDPPVAGRTLLIGSDVEIAKRVTRDLATKFGEVSFDDGGFYYYAGTHWAQVNEVAHRLAIHEYDGAIYTTPNETEIVVQLNKSRVNSVIHEMRAVTSQPNLFKDAPAGINCATGFITFDQTGMPSLVPHDRAHAQRHVLPGRWQPGAPTNPERGTLLHKLIRGVFKGDPDEDLKIRLLSQIAGCVALGYATRLAKPKAVIMYGQSAENGKSQTLDALRGLLPASAIASVPATKLGDQSYLVHLAGKLLNATDELKGSGAITSETFKACIIGEVVTARDLYRSAIEFRPIALHLFATNVLPTFEGGFDRGVLRRLLLLVFNRFIPEHERVVDLGKRIAKEEPDQLLAFAVGGATDLIRAGNFIIPSSSEAGLKKWSGAADPVIAWVSACVEAADAPLPGQRVVGLKSGWVHGCFKEWAVGEGYRSDSIPAVNGFVQRLQAAFPGVRSRHTNAGNFLVGLKIVEGRTPSPDEMED
jgi:phage/plasmid-associated DNA primase